MLAILGGIVGFIVVLGILGKILRKEQSAASIAGGLIGGALIALVLGYCIIEWLNGDGLLRLSCPDRMSERECEVWVREKAQEIHKENGIEED